MSDKIHFALFHKMLLWLVMLHLLLVVGWCLLVMLLAFIYLWQFPILKSAHSYAICSPMGKFNTSIWEYYSFIPQKLMYIFTCSQQYNTGYWIHFSKPKFTVIMARGWEIFPIDVWIWCTSGLWHYETLILGALFISIVIGSEVVADNNSESRPEYMYKSTRPEYRIPFSQCSRREMQ